MSLNNVEIPYGAYWSTPFTKWQGTLQHLHSMKFAAWVAKNELAKRDIDPAIFDSGVLGMTNAQYQSFYGAPWPLYELGAKLAPGHVVGQVCATSVRGLFSAASEIALGMSETTLLMTADRCSNGAHIYYPSPNGAGGYGQSEDQVTYNMQNDAIAGHSMIQTGENVAKQFNISREELDAVALRRFEQYQAALADDQAFQKRYMTLPFSVPNPSFKKEATVLTGDEGVFPTTAEGLAKLRPVYEGGVVTYGNMTHPADGNASVILTTPDKARELSRDQSIKISLCGFGQSRTELAHMPAAPIEAAARALAMAGVTYKEIKAIKTHNPFAVNDVAFAKATGVDVMEMNNYGCSMIWGHPQGPTGMRAVIELIEELVLLGGGYGLFTGCAAGDTGMATVIRVEAR
ncbi:3-ketoacyl-CoA thiolase [Marinobacterium lacunae]|uniref:3-ketoacyl-CoA thiolase n=1 Tax=Marinobacterium lacunae TaxID=1232683 RepID=A0A081FYQ0_9GAMM|nr:thiolase family protein [Marinobacterium lacunae]KEA63655.1 3-ketoacyl-CoA thiolase [Marinobacterium lacunae]MBR9884503.1 thiolase family protein [Oceanospirillales bacterium]